MDKSELKKSLLIKMDFAGKELSKGGTKAEGAYREAYQKLVVNGFASQLRKKYRGS